MSEPIRVLISDDQALVRSGLRMILEAQPDIEVCGEAENGADAITESKRLAPDVVLMDVRMPELDGIEATRRVLADPSNRSHVLVLTTFNEDEYVYDAFTAGACGFLLKSAAPEELVHAVRRAASGELLLAPEITRRLVDDFIQRPAPSRKDPRLEQLTERELEVLRLIGTGRTNSEIASELFLGEATVKTHINRLFSKLELRDRSHAVITAYESGLVG